MTLVLLFKGIFATFILIWASLIMVFAIQHFNIVFKENYWNRASEKKFMIKLKCIVSSIENDLVFLTPQNLICKINNIYHNMNYPQRKKFRIEIYQNGLKPRIKRLIDNY